MDGALPSWLVDLYKKDEAKSLLAGNELSDLFEDTMLYALCLNPELSSGLSKLVIQTTELTKYTLQRGRYSRT
jgi:hypothetical protein